MQNALIKSLSRASLNALKPHLEEVALPAREILYEPGDEIVSAFFLDAGMVSLLAVMRDGGGIETATVGREGGLGLMIGLGPHRTYVRAVVQIPGIAWRIRAAPFRKLVQEHQELRDLVVRNSDGLLSQVQLIAACNAIHSLEARLSRWILQTHDRIDGDQLPLTHELLSQMLGVRRSSVSEIASRLQAAGLISYSRGMVLITDRPALERYACECYRTMWENAAKNEKRGP